METTGRKLSHVAQRVYDRVTSQEQRSPRLPFVRNLSTETKAEILPGLLDPLLQEIESASSLNNRLAAETLIELAEGDPSLPVDRLQARKASYGPKDLADWKVITYVVGRIAVLYDAGRSEVVGGLVEDLKRSARAPVARRYLLEMGRTDPDAVLPRLIDEIEIG